MPDYKILVIDYEPRSIERLLVPLRNEGYEVEVARNGVEGIEAFDRISPDLTLVEAMLPKIHGFDVCKELKKSPHGKKSSVVILSSVYRGHRYRMQARFQYDADGYLEKPISDSDLLTAVSSFLGSAGRAEVPEPTPGKPRKPEVHGQDQ